MVDAKTTFHDICSMFGQNAKDPNFSMILCVKSKEFNTNIIHGRNATNILCCLATIVNSYVTGISDNKGYDVALSDFFTRTEYSITLKEEFLEKPEAIIPLDSFAGEGRDLAFSSCIVKRYGPNYNNCVKAQLDTSRYFAMSKYMNEHVLKKIDETKDPTLTWVLAYNYAGINSVFDVRVKSGIPDLITIPIRSVYMNIRDKNNHKINYKEFQSCLTEIINNLQYKKEAQ